MALSFLFALLFFSLSSLSLLSCLLLSLLSSLLFLDILGDKLLVLLLLLFGGLEAVQSLVLDNSLSADPLLSNKSLDLWCFVVGPLLLLTIFVSALLCQFSVVDILAYIILLFVKVEEASDVVSSLLAEFVGPVNIGDLVDVLFSLLNHTECDDCKIRATDASAN